MHTVGSLERDGFVEVFHSLLVVIEEEVESSHGSFPQAWIVGLALGNHRVGKGDELFHLGCIDGAGTNHLDVVGYVFFIGKLAVGIVALAVERFLSVVYEILNEVEQCVRVGVLLVDGAYACKVAVFAHTPFQAEHIALLGIYLDGGFFVAGVQQCVGIDAAHHVAVDALRQQRGSSYPECGVVGIALQEHIGTHLEQRVLRAQLLSAIALCGCKKLLYAAVALGKLLFGGVVPRVLHGFADVEIVVQMLKVDHHFAVAAFLGLVHDVVLVPPVGEIGIGCAYILPPLLVEAFFIDAVEHFAWENAEQIVVVGDFRTTGKSRCKRQKHRNVSG